MVEMFAPWNIYS